MYIPPTRTDQLTFFLGYTSRIKRSRYAAIKAIEDIKRTWNVTFPYGKIFEYCPENSDLDTLLSSYHRAENNTKSNLNLEIFRILEEFLFLKSDFFPPCCGDGFTEFFLNKENQIILVCDKCEKRYDLYATETSCDLTCKMKKIDFMSMFDEETEIIWPHHQELASLLQNKN